VSVAPPAVRLRGLTKDFGPVRALASVDCEVGRGEIVGLVGENGAGKSTLMNVLAGVLSASSYVGAVEIDGAPVSFRSPEDASQKGAVLIPQELSLHPDFTVAENVLLGRLPRHGGLVRWRSAEREAARFTDLVGLQVSPRARVGSLAPAAQQQVAIARGLARHPRLLMLDEPTAALDGDEARRLLDILRRLAGEGVSVLYVSHRLDEVLAVTDRVLVLRNGRLVADRSSRETSRREIISDMLGGVDWSAPASEAGERRRGEIVLRARGISLDDPRTRRARLRDVDLDLHAGEVVGLVGLLGSGRTELLWSLFGAIGHGGSVEVNGRATSPGPAGAIEAGIGLVTEERRATGLFPLFDVAGNVSAASLGPLSSFGWLRRRAEREMASGVVERLAVKAESVRQPVTRLSGGNQQKVLLGRWLGRGVRVLLLDEPARGIDVGAKAEVYRQIRALADDHGMAALVTSSDVAELVGVCDRFLVLARGAVVAELAAEEVSDATLLERAAHGGAATAA
jgi:ABC-type sugar transport system ATPase subunit